MTAQFRKFRFFILLVVTVLAVIINPRGVWGQTAVPVVLDVAWSPDGDLYAVVDDGGNLSIMDPTQPVPIFQFAMTSPTLFDAAVAWNPEGSLLAAGIGYQVYIWETTTWQLVHQFVGGDSDGYVLLAGMFEEIPEGIASITWSGDSRYVVSGSLSYLTTAWDNQEAQVIYQAPDGSGGGPGRVWLEDGWMGDGATRLNAFTGEEVVIDRSEIQYRFGPGGGANATSVHPNHIHIAWGTEFGFLLIYDLYTLRGVQALEVTQSEPPAPRRALTDIAWNGDGNFIAAVSRDGEVYVANLTTGEVTTVIHNPAQLNAIDWNPQTNEIIYAGVSESGQPILSSADVSGIGGVPQINQPPTADAGPDQMLMDSDDDGSELVTLDGSGSSDPDGNIESYVWTEDEVEIATGVSPQVNLSVGVHTITLTVTDDDGLTDTDEVVITVNPPATTSTLTVQLDGVSKINRISFSVATEAQTYDRSVHEVYRSEIIGDKYIDPLPLQRPSIASVLRGPPATIACNRSR